MKRISKPTIDVATAFRAFSDPTRLRILNLLRDGEICVCDLVELLKVPQPTASRHLAYLRRAGLVQARKQDQWNYYRLAPAESAVHEKLLECLAACGKETPQLSRDAARLQRYECRDCCE